MKLFPTPQTTEVLAHCLGCGYDLTASDREGRCSECGRAPRSAERVPVMRWIDYDSARRMMAALRIALIAVRALGWGTISLGLYAAVIPWAVLADRTGRVFALVAFAIAGWFIYAVCGLASAVVLWRIKGTVLEPEGIREQRRMVAYVGVFILLFWAICAFLGILVMNAWPWFNVLIVPVNGILVGAPVMACNSWASAMLASLSRDRALRRARMRSHRRLVWAVLIWALFALAASVGCRIAIEEWRPLARDELLVIAILCAVLLTGGMSYGIIMLRAARPVRELERQLQRLTRQPATDTRPA